MGIAAIFLDRDGTIIADAHYPKEASEVAWLPGAVEGLLRLQQKGYRLFLVSNQSGVGRALITQDQFFQVHFRFVELVEEAGIRFEECFYCFDAPNQRSSFRKPETGMIPRVWKGEPIQWNRSYLVGDRQSDLELGIRLGTHTNFLVRTGLGEETASKLDLSRVPNVEIASDLLEIAEKIPPFRS